MYADVREADMKNKPFSRLFASNTALFLIVLFLMALLPLLIENKAAATVIAVVVWIVLTVYSFIYEAKREKDLLEYIMSLSFNGGNSSKDALLRVPLPISVMQLSGNVLWYNEQFRDTFELNGVNDFNLLDIIDAGVGLSDFTEPKSGGVKIKVKNKYFNVLVNITRNENDEIVAVLYWMDETKFVSLKQLYDNTRPVICSLIIDNYDEVMQNTPDDSRTMLMGTIERAINEWIGKTGGIFRKSEKDKYLIIFEHQHLNTIINEKFAILEKVKNISIGNKIPATVSLGLGFGGNTLNEDMAFSRNALDMALGRGGDQAVIKDKNKFSYFGGNNKELEKYTRVKTRVMAFAMKQLVNQAENIVIMGHKNADLDSFGAAVGILSSAINQKKDAYIVLETSNEFTNKMLKRFKLIEKYSRRFINSRQAEEMTNQSTLLVVVDVYRPSFTEAPNLLEKTDNIVVIDHHRKGAEFIENASLMYHEPSASSACEMVTELLEYIDDGESIDKNVAEALYSGIKLDTKDFSFKTGVRTFEAAAYLRRRGVDTQSVKMLFQNQKKVVEKISDIVCSALIYRGNIAISTTKTEYSDIQSIAAAAADELLSIEGIEASFTLCKIEDTVYISGRAVGNINVQVILEYLGGGGHAVVAGAQIKCDMNEAVSALKSAIDKYMDNSSEEN